MPIKVTFERAKNWYESAFPGNKLVQFTSTSEPCSINCRKHGLVENLGYVNLRSSKYGCPECAKENAILNSLRTQQYKTALLKYISDRNLFDVVNQAIGFDYEQAKISDNTNGHGVLDNTKGRNVLDSTKGYDVSDCVKKSVSLDMVAAYSAARDAIEHGSSDNRYKKRASKRELGTLDDASRSTPDTHKKGKTKRSKSNTLAEALPEYKVNKKLADKSLARKGIDGSVLVQQAKQALQALHSKGHTRELSSSYIHPLADDNQKIVTKSDFVLVPYHSDVKVAAGEGRYNGVLETLSLPISLPELQKLDVRPNNIICCRILDDSMEPMIQNGTLVGINTAATEIQNGKVYAFVDKDGLSSIKVLVKDNDSHIKIHSYNYSYETKTVASDSIRVIGRVFWAAVTL